MKWWIQCTTAPRKQWQLALVTTQCWLPPFYITPRGIWYKTYFISVVISCITMFVHTAIMCSAVVKFLQLAIICIVMINRGLCHGEGKKQLDGSGTEPTTCEYISVRVEFGPPTCYLHCNTAWLKYYLCGYSGLFNWWVLNIIFPFPSHACELKRLINYLWPTVCKSLAFIEIVAVLQAPDGEGILVTADQ